jgi:hypothetical protein
MTLPVRIALDLAQRGWPLSREWRCPSTQRHAIHLIIVQGSDGRLVGDLMTTMPATNRAPLRQCL